MYRWRAESQTAGGGGYRRERSVDEVPQAKRTNTHAFNDEAAAIGRIAEIGLHAADNAVNRAGGGRRSHRRAGERGGERGRYGGRFTDKESNHVRHEVRHLSRPLQC